MIRLCSGLARDGVSGGPPLIIDESRFIQLNEVEYKDVKLWGERRGYILHLW